MQKFVINTEHLSKALAKVSQAVNAKSVLPALSNILCKAGNNKLELIASDLELTIIERVGCETVGEPFEVLLPFIFISKVVALNKKSCLIFNLEKKGMKIVGPYDVYEIKSLMKVDHFPTIPETPKKNNIEINSEFIEVLVSALETTGKDDTNRPQFTKVLVELRPEGVTIASTDGSYYVFSYLIKSLVAEEIEDLLLGGKVITALQGIEKAKLSWHKKTIAFDSAETTIIYTRPDMKFANYRAIFPDDFTSNISLDRSSLIDGLVKCNLNTDHMKKMKITLSGNGNNQIVLNSNDDDMGININIALPGVYKGSVETISVSSERMLKLVKQVEFQTIDLAIHHSNKAILFRSTEDECYLGLLMPIVTN